MIRNEKILKDEKGNYYLKMNNCTEDDYSVYRIVNSGDCVYISSLKQDETPGMVRLEDVVELNDNVKLVPYERRLRGFRSMKKSDNCFYYKDKLVNQFETYVVTPEKRLNIGAYFFESAELFVSYTSLENAVQEEYLYDDILDYDFAIVEYWGVVLKRNKSWEASTAIEFVKKLDFREVVSRFWGINGENNLDCFFMKGENSKDCYYCADIHSCDSCENLSYSVGSVDCDYGCQVFFSKGCKYCSDINFCFDVNFSHSCMCCWKINHARGLLFNKKRELEEKEMWKLYFGDKIKNFNDLYHALEYNKIRHMLRKPGATVTAKEVAEFRKYLLDEVL